MNKNPEHPLYIEDGDVLIIPKRPSHVSIMGAVQQTTTTQYNNSYTYLDYIATAGGVTKSADLRRAYLMLANGQNTLLNKSTIIPVGSIIVIPPKLDNISVLGLTDIVSRVLGNIATSILAVNNVR